MKKKYEDALKIFKLKVEVYPSSFNTHDSYGEGLLKIGDTLNAIKAYKKSYELNPDNTNGRELIRKFEQE